MKRRNKKDMEYMKNTCTLYLLQVNNDPHKAYDNYIKENLSTGLDYYIKGIKDFIKVSQELATELNRKEQMKRRDREVAEQNDFIINYLLNISSAEAYNLYKQYKDNGTHTDKLNLNNIYMMTQETEEKHKRSYIDQSVINTIKQLNILSVTA